MLRVLLIGCGDVALRTAALLRGRSAALRAHAPRRRRPEAARARHRADRRRSRPIREPRAGCARRRSPCCISRRRRRRAATIRARSTLVAALARARSIPQRFVYVSTSGVYGDCAGARVDETRPRRARTPRARRRVAAEDRLRDWAHAQRRVAVDPARAGHLRRDAPAARAHAAGHAGARAPTTTSSPTTSTPTISRGQRSRRSSAASPTARTT